MESSEFNLCRDCPARRYRLDTEGPPLSLVRCVLVEEVNYGPDAGKDRSEGSAHEMAGDMGMSDRLEGLRRCTENMNTGKCALYKAFGFQGDIVFHSLNLN